METGGRPSALRARASEQNAKRTAYNEQRLYSTLHLKRLPKAQRYLTGALAQPRSSEQSSQPLEPGFPRPTARPSSILSPNPPPSQTKPHSYYQGLTNRQIRYLAARPFTLTPHLRPAWGQVGVNSEARDEGPLKRAPVLVGDHACLECVWVRSSIAVAGM